MGNSKNGKLEPDFIKIGSIDVTSYLKSTIENEIKSSSSSTSSSQTLDMTLLYQEMLFPNTSTIKIESIEFGKDEIIMTIVPVNSGLSD
jgi:hypothetical protein